MAITDKSLDIIVQDEAEMKKKFYLLLTGINGKKPASQEAKDRIAALNQHKVKEEVFSARNN